MSGLVDAIAFFDAIAARYDKDYALDPAATRARMARVVAEVRGHAASLGRARVLDLGVGTGRELPALLDAGFAVTGVDASERMLEQCRKRARPIPLVVHDFYSPMPFPDASFDAVLALHGTLSHPPSREALGGLAREIERVLSDDGLLYVETPAPAWLTELEAHPIGDERRAAFRAGPQRTRHEDVRTGVAVEALVLGPDDWTEILGPAFATRVEPLSRFEQAVFARRARR